MNDHTTYDQSPKLCECGCGQPAPIATVTNRKYGWIKGQPLRFIHGHNAKKKLKNKPTSYCACGCGQPVTPRRKRENGHEIGKWIVPQFISGHNRRRHAENRFWEKVNKNGPNGCWLWTNSLNRAGYGRLGVGDTIVLAHRFSYELHKGPIEDGLGCLHRCDNPACVNPDHLFLGTQNDNIQDMINKKRNSLPLMRAKLTESDVLAIRQLHKAGERLVTLGKRYNVTPETISDIVKHKTWRHIP